MTIFTLLLFTITFLAKKGITTESQVQPNYLAVQIPFYIKDIEEMGYFSIAKWFFGIAEVCIILLCFVHLPFFDGIKRILLAGWGTFLLTNHILTFSFFSKIAFIFWVLSITLGLIASFLSLGKGYEHTFFAAGATYSLTYFLTLTFRLRTLFTVLIIFLVLFVIFFFIFKSNRQFHYALCKAAVVSLTTIALIEAFMPFAPIDKLHCEGKGNYFKGMYILPVYLIVFSLSLV
ncbi:hypothetical protein TUBRATIS_20130, partial [Tubulinosema ratisbonensis]